MNYQKIYTALTSSRQALRISKKQTGYELHHIYPRSLGGSNDASNLVLLTYREHYVAHWLLTKIYPNEPKIHYGFLCMLRDPHGNRKLTSRMVETIKKNYSEFKKWHAKIENPGRSKKSREKAKERMLSDENPMSKFPEKNHTAKKTTVYYIDGTIKEFKTKKEFMETLVNLTPMQKRYKIHNNNLKEFGIINIELEKKDNKPSESCVGRKWYTNGIDNEYVYPGQESDGYTQGMTKNKKT